MPTYSDEVNVYNPNAIDDAIGEAATTASKYIATVDQTGIMVHPASDSTSGWKISSAIELLKSGVSYIKAWLNGTVPTVQIGASANGNYALIDDDSFDIYHGNTQMAHFGYGEGVTEDGTAVAPYYTLGTRKTTSSGYSSSSTYAVGDHVLHSGMEYVCIEKITTPEAWNAAHWQLAIGSYSHAEGFDTTASGFRSHAEGFDTTASGITSHAEGLKTMALSGGSHAQNTGTIAASYSQTAIGRYNEEDADSEYALIIGNGFYNLETGVTRRSNALTVGWDGTIECAGDTDWTTLNSTIKYRIHHGVCYVVGISTNVTQVATGGTVVGTLPTGARPTIDVEGAATTMGNNCAQWKVGTNGQITVWGFGSATKYWAFTASYPL